MPDTRPLVFVDTETTGLGPHRLPWEIAMVRRAPDHEDDRTIVIQIDDVDLADADPTALRIGGFYARHCSVMEAVPDDVYVLPGAAAAQIVFEWTVGASLIGVNPAFDADVLADLLRWHQLTPPWHHHLIDMVAMGLGFMAAQGDYPGAQERSYQLSERCGVPRPDLNEAHTALGDALWVERWYDQLTATSRPTVPE